MGESLILFFLCLPHLKVGSNITEFPLLIKDVFLFTFKHSWNQKTSYNQWVYLIRLGFFFFFGAPNMVSKSRVYLRIKGILESYVLRGNVVTHTFSQADV